MTPLQAAKAHCCNYQPDRSCLGVAYDDNLRAHRLFPEGSDCALYRCERCQWFEEAVLPQVPASVGEAYHKSLPAGAETTVRPQRGIKLCPDCHRCELEPRKSYCETCARIRTRESKRRHVRLKRGLDVENRLV